MSHIKCGELSLIVSDVCASPAVHCLICFEQFEKSPKQRSQSGHLNGLIPKWR